MPNRVALTALGALGLYVGAVPTANAAYQVLLDQPFETIDNSLPHSFVGDLDGDGVVEFVGERRSGYGGEMIIRDGMTGQEEFAFQPPEWRTIYSVTVLNVDIDSNAEALIRSSGFNWSGITVLDYSGAPGMASASASSSNGGSYSVLWSGQIAFTTPDDIGSGCIGDFDGDDHLEIVGRAGSGIEIRDLVSGVSEFNQGVPIPVDQVAVMDLDGNGTDEIVVTSNVNGGQIAVVGYSAAPTSVNLDDTVPDAHTWVGQPNPFKERLAIPVPRTHTGLLEVRVFDASGRLVRVLQADQAANVGGSILWDGRDQSGVPVGSGMYLYSVRSNGREVSTKKSVLVR